ncbi:GGDEF domain-containing protein [Roseateles sp. DB2]|uniref:GGDEF domain-containing protein n=1 Tax=Roseateles sp. DB2 TaxID=3453717 RepID=UPI003EE953F6
MLLDTPTLLSLLLLELLSLMVMLPLLMGAPVSRAARFAQGYIALQCIGWMALWLRQASGAPVSDGLGGFVAMLALSASLSALWLALRDWLGRRPGRRAMMGAPLVLALASLQDGSGADHFAVAWSGLGLALQMLALALACSWPREAEQKGMESRHATPVEHKDRAWRTLLGLGFGAMAAVTLLRAGLHFLERDAGWEAGLTQAIILGAHVMLLVSVLAILVAWRGETELHLQRQAQTDALTGLANRRAFGSRSDELISLARRHGEPLCLVMLDLDLFKKVNDDHGHEGGDRALALFASCVQQVLRVGDLAGRVGGEEFCVLLARSDELGPRAMDARLRAVLLARAQKELGFPLDFSAGWALLRPGDRSVEDMMRRADAALYEAKRSGRGRLCDEPGWTPADQAG